MEPDIGEQSAGQELIFLPIQGEPKKGLRRRSKSAGRSAAEPLVVDVAEAIAWSARETGKELGATQQQAVRQALCSRALIITGGPGVGKTTLLSALLRIVQSKKMSCLLCAPTGRAAKRLAEATGLEAQTIHRLLEIRSAAAGFSRNESNPLSCDLMVVDECSMVDVNLMHGLLRALPKHAHLILVGDVDQLPSIGPGWL